MKGVIPFLGYRAQVWLVSILIASIIVLDQVTKYAVRAQLFLGESVPETWPVRFTHVENTGSAFGLFTDQTTVLIGASIFALGIICFLYRRIGNANLLLRISLGLQLGGGISNLVDRIRLGEVTDFIDLRVWPIFNLADSCVVIGILLLLYFLFWESRRTAKS